MSGCRVLRPLDERIREDRNRHSEFYRAINELPTALLIGIVILAIVTPF